MSFIVAVTGKGGVGKTTIAGLIVSRLIAGGRSPVLAVDADPNSCLDAALGVSVEKTIGGVREEAKLLAGSDSLKGISKQELLELKISESMVEAKDFDLIAMGRPEGPGCYCYANNVLKNVLGEIARHYPYVVLDNEAGLENLSRRIVQKVNLLIAVTDPSRRGLDTVIRLHSLTHEMGIEYDRLVLIVNRIRKNRLESQIDEIKEKIGAFSVITIQDDEMIAGMGEEGRSMSELPPDNKSVEKIDELIDFATE